MTIAIKQPIKAEIIPTISIQELATDYMAILSTQSKTRNTEAMSQQILYQLKQINNVRFEQDAYGNIYAVKGAAKTYPAYVCHIDTVHDIKETYEVVRSKGGYYTALSEDKGELKQVGIGGDDKCGIIACIEMLHKLKNVKCVFFLDEEGGCLGSEKGNLDFFNDCRFAIQIDRQDSGDIITVGKGGSVALCSEEFIKLAEDIGKKYGYKACEGKNTDVVKLKERGLKISCINLSAGYYNPHKDSEFIIERELLNCIQFAKALASFTTVFPHTYTPKVQPVRHRPYSQYNTRSYADKVVSPQACAECDKNLNVAEQDDRLCRDCINKFNERAYLEIRGGNEPDMLVVESNVRITDGVILPANLTLLLPTKRCLLCGEDLENEEIYYKRGYCEPCAWCKCGSLYKNYEEMVGSFCGKCLKKVDDRVAQCSSPKCKMFLSTEEEIKDNICFECKQEMLLNNITA